MSGAAGLVQRAADWIHSVGALDLVAALVLLLFLFLGLVHGLVGQAARLVALVAGYFVARGGAPRLAPLVGAVAPDSGPATRTGIAYAALFVGVLLATAFLAFLLKKAVDTLHLGFLDRIGGAVLGLATGVVFQCAILVGVVFFVREERLAVLAENSRSLGAALRAIERAPIALPPHARARIEAARGLRDQPGEGDSASTRPAASGR